MHTHPSQEHAYKTVPLEVHPEVKHHAGSVSMARGGDPHSGGSSFFIMLGDAPHLDGQYGGNGGRSAGWWQGGGRGGDTLFREVV